MSCADRVPFALGDAREQPRVELETLSGSVALVTLMGEHDIATRSLVAEGLGLAAARRRHVLVDLTGCAFLDSTTISLLVSSHNEVSSHGGEFILILPSDSCTPTARALELLHLDEVLVMHGSLDAARASLEHNVRLRDLRVRFGERDRFQAECSCGWQGAEHSGVLATRHARADATNHADTRPARARPGRQR